MMITVNDSDRIFICILIQVFLCNLKNVIV